MASVTTPALSLSRKGRSRSLLAAALLGSSALAASAWAEVATDGTLGRKVRLTGRDVEVGAELGRVSGRNLFHSFERFGVEGGGSVTFTGPEGLDNVVSRVTGGEASRIDGALRSRVPGADVYLVNPSGIVFGPGARLDVPGSFHASTADEVRFPDGARFSALDPGGSTLSVAPPEAFGFLGGRRPAAITVDGAPLFVPAGEALSLVGGDVVLGGSLLASSGGTFTLAGLGGAGSADVIAGTVEGDVSGTVALVRTGVLATGEGGGQITIRGGRALLLGGAQLINGTIDRSTTRGVTIEAGEVLISGSESRVAENTLGAGDPGPITIRGGSVTLSDGGTINGLTASGGNGADILVEAGRLVVDGGLVTNLAGMGSTAARAGNVTVVAGEVALLRGGTISTATLSTADAGRIRLSADSVTLSDGGLLQAASVGPGDAGGVEIEAGRLAIDEGNVRLTGVTTSSTGGRGGPIAIDVRELELADQGVISSETDGPNAAGTVTIRADDLRIRSGGGVNTSTASAAPAGEIRIEAGRLEIDGRGFERPTGVASASVGSTGPAGGISIAARELVAQNGFVTTAGAGAEGGRIVIVADEVVALDDSIVTSRGIQAAPGASLITVEAPLIALNDSRVTSLTGRGRPLSGSGEASLLGETTVISVDSLVAASTSLEITGVETDIGAGLQLPPGALLDADGLLGQGCEARRAGRASSFTRAGRGGLPPAPDRPLASAGAVGRGGAKAAGLVPGPLLAAACDGPATGS